MPLFGRSDGKRVKGENAFYHIIPHIMSKRMDATNYTKSEINIEPILAWLRELKSEGHKIGLMDVILTAFVRIFHEHPELNRFVVNKKIFQRNYFSISFIVIKGERADMEETVVKIMFDGTEDVFEISRRIREIISQNNQRAQTNNTDNFIGGIMRIPVIPAFLINLLKFSDKHGFLPKPIVLLSPFHTSIFVSNLASINLNYVYHHLYEFGTTSAFCSIGKPYKTTTKSGESRKILPLSFSLDERITSGAGFAGCLFNLKKYLEKPAKYLVSAKEEKQEENE
jgi:2-oxoacid dehydrogenases acyltransferase (catalytic domain).